MRVRDLEPQIRYDGPHLTKLDSKREMCFVACVCSGGGGVRVCVCACARVRVCACARVRACVHLV